MYFRYLINFISKYIRGIQLKTFLSRVSNFFLILLLYVYMNVQLKTSKPLKWTHVATYGNNVFEN